MSGLGGKYSVKASAESDKRKRQWILAGDTEGACLDDDITTRSDRAQCHCVIHNRACDVVAASADCHIALCGWSCKQLSSCNSTGLDRSSVLAKGVGSSGKTFSGLVAALDKCAHIGVYIGENVDEMAKVFY